MNGIKVIKIGGNVVDNPLLLEQFIRDFSAIGTPKVLVHGGGVMASQMQKQLGQQPVMIEGRRVTDAETLKVVTMVYAGWCSKSIVALLQKNGCNAIGLSGADADLIRATKRPPVRKYGPSSSDSEELQGDSNNPDSMNSHGVPGDNNKPGSRDSDGNQARRTETVIDYGYVGDVDPQRINAGFLMQLINAGITPVVCAITHDGNGNLLNTNADTIASSIAVSLASCNGIQAHDTAASYHKASATVEECHAFAPEDEFRRAVSLIYCFEKDGVLYDKDDDGSVILEITPGYFRQLKEEGRVAAGMIPKLDNSFKALENGVREVVIKHARNLGNGIGTRLKLR